MKRLWKSVMMIVITIMMILPISVMAEDEKLKGNATTIQQACAEEQIAFDHDYKSNQEGKVNIYLFRGNGCSHCHEFLQYLESIIDQYGKYINVVTFEVWGDNTNSDLLEKVAEKFGDDASGVPYIVIGEKTFSGYSSEMNEEIELLIKEEYEKEDRYDVMEELGASIDFSTEEVDNTVEKSSSDIIILVVGLIVIGGITFFVVMARKQN